MGYSRRIVSSALVLALAGLVGIVLGEVTARMIAVDEPARAQPAATAPTATAPTAAAAPIESPATRVVLALDVDRTVRIDGGAPLGDAVALTTALRPRLSRIDVVHVAPGAGVPWSDVVELVERLRSLGVRVLLHDAPPE